VADNSPHGLRRSISALEAEFHKLLREAPWRNNTQTLYPQDQPQQKGNGRVRQVPVDRPSPQNSKEAKASDNKSFPWWRIVEGIGIAAAVVVAVINACQWSDANKNFRIDERAWIGLSKVLLNIPYSAEHIGITPLLINTGKTPGYCEGVNVTITSTGSPNQVILSKSLPCSVMSPGGIFPLEISEPDRSVPTDEFDRLTSRRISHEFRVTIRYRDAFGTDGLTKLCFALTGKQEDYTENQPFPSCDPTDMR
jgi:hypothetical protein